MNAPCYKCPDRNHPTCYATCERYQAYHAQQERNRHARMIQGEITAIQRNQRDRIMRDRKRKSR